MLLLTLVQCRFSLLQLFLQLRHVLLQPAAERNESLTRAGVVEQQLTMQMLCMRADCC
jgi:hypothetical protein